MLMKIKYLLTTVAFLLTTVSTQAVPAKPGVKKTIRKADGSVVELTLRGDECFSYYTDASGSAFKLLPGDILKPLTDKQIEDTWTANRVARRAALKTRTRRVGEPTPSTTGKHRGLVILMQFKDLAFITPEPKQTFNRFFNEIGYHDNGMAGSVRDYFLAQSYNKLEIDFDVVGPFTAKENMAYYGENVIKNNIEGDARAEDLIAEAVEMASTVVDYSNYDWDDDGEVDQVFVIYAGYAEAQGASSETIWPHEYTLRSKGLFVYNGKRVTTYGCSSELMGDGRNEVGIIDGIGSACHEFSHCLGLSDTYNTNNGEASFGMGPWDVMASGNYNNDSRTPAGFTSYERWFSGWLEPTELKGDMTQITDMKPLVESPECYVLYNEANQNEYYLLENRQKVGFDAGLDGHGLLVLHVDYNASVWSKNKINADSEHQRLTVIPADGILSRGMKSLAGDPFPGIKGNTALANYTTPASTLYNANSDGSYYMSKAIDSITESTDGLISFVALRPELVTPKLDEVTEEEGESSFTITWPAVSDAAGYQLELNEEVFLDPADSRTQEFDFAQTQTTDGTSKNISSSLRNYGLSNWSGYNLYATPNKLLIGTSLEPGYIQTPGWDVPQSKDITIVIGVDLIDPSYPEYAELHIYFYNNGDQYASGRGSYVGFTNDGKFVFNFPDIDYDKFFIKLLPDEQIYLKYFAVYDGIWSKDELGIDDSPAASRRVGKPYTNTTIFDTATNSITLTDLNTEGNYNYRLRTKGADGIYSVWTAPKSLTFGSSGISGIVMDTRKSDVIYDLHGRSYGNDASALPKGIYIIGGKKVVK